ncbi:MAG: glycosyltransferase family 4 protein [Gammaproteobacteria bacterium]|nr:glycosyltransferase family 4 protein [Gammaproteobacteria bacterium]
MDDQQFVKIAYFHVFGKPPIEESVYRMLGASFPEFDVQSITLIPLLRRRPLVILGNFFAMIREYGLGSLKNYNSFKQAFLSTPYLFQKISELCRDAIVANKEHYVFSFQLQSLFDCSVPGIPNYVYTDHTHLLNHAYQGFSVRFKSERWLALEKKIYANATGIFTRSENVSQSLERDYECAPEKIECVYVGMNTPGPVGATAGISNNSKSILFIGSDWARKGGDILIQAFSQVLESHPDATLTIVGARPQVSVPNCRVLGRVPLEQIDKHYSRASLFCLPTLQEPFGVVLLEAMAHGLPVIATSIGAVPEVVTADTGILVPPHNVDALTAALNELLADPDRARKLGARGQRLVITRYNWTTVGAAIRHAILDDSEAPPAASASA